MTAPAPHITTGQDKNSPDNSNLLQQLHNQRKTHIKAYNPLWPQWFEEEAKKLSTILGPKAIMIEHIGSTAIPGIKAKPIIDILITTDDINQIDSFNPEMEQAGYIAGGEFGLPGRRFFCKGDDAHCHIHVHIYKAGHQSISTYLNFKYYMIAHPQEAKKYELLKDKLAKKYPHNRTGYTQGKHDFIQQVLNKAADWIKET